jgi:FlaA1/EpsC-like NDP-sugar epimerase
MIRLSGKEPDVDVEVDFIGVRPGEKLHEELWAKDEEVEPTTHPKILRCNSMPVDPSWLEDELAELERLVEAGETLDVVNRLGVMARAPQRVSAEAPAPEPA